MTIAQQIAHAHARRVVDRYWALFTEGAPTKEVLGPMYRRVYVTVLEYDLSRAIKKRILFNAGLQPAHQE